MAYGYLGQNTPNQTVNNSGVFSITDSADLESQGKLGGSLELIEEQTFSGVSVVDFTSIQENKYDVHCMQLSNIKHTGGLDTTNFQLYENGVLETASVYQQAYQTGTSGGLFQEGKSTATDDIYWSYNNNGTTQDTKDSESGYVYFYNLGNSSKYSFFTHQMGFTDFGLYRFSFGGAVLPQASLVNGIRIKMHNSFNASGTIKLYGVKQI
jgi:hypothetical protein